MQIKNVFNLPSGKILLLDCDGYLIESTEMRDVSVDGKKHEEVRTATDPRVIWKHLLPYDKKWLLTVSTQKGCVHNCKFCDVAPLPYKGNLSCYEMIEQVEIILKNTDYVKTCAKAKIGFARMGEPSHNVANVLNAMRDLPNISKKQKKDINWLPCFNTILPMKGVNPPENVLKEVLNFKERVYDGFLHLQISCNSTDEEKRQELFGGSPVLSLPEIVNIVNKHDITSRTVTLNFIVMKGVEIDVKKLQAMGLNGSKFAVKLIPLNHTEEADKYKLETLANYNNYDKLLELRNDFRAVGIPIVVDAIAKCEEAGLCCGQLAQIYL